MSRSTTFYYSLFKIPFRFKIPSFIFFLPFIIISLSHSQNLSTSTNSPTPTMIFKLDSVEEFQHIPGGFTNPPLPGGDVFVGGIPIDPSGKNDGQGLMVVSSPGNVDLFMFPKIEVGEDFVLLRGFVLASAKDAAIALAALDGSMDGSIATNIPANSSMFQDGYHRMLVLYDPPGDSVIPIFQVSNISDSQTIIVYFDNLEVYRLPKGVGIPAELLEDVYGSVNVFPTPTSTMTPSPTPILIPQSETITIPLTNLPVDAKPLEMVLIPAGTFMMGSPDNEVGRENDEGPQHQVTLTKSFYMGKYEVTQAQWLVMMESNPSDFKGNNRPVENVSWDDCQSFIQKLNQLEQGTFRLPTEAEWEYSCRAGTTTRYYWGDDQNYSQIGQHAWYPNNSSSQTQEVGLKLPNAWGLFDMSGNVWEWCQDGYGKYTSNPQVDPIGVIASSGSLLRGGACWYSIWYCRSASRYHRFPLSGNELLGLRLVRSLTP